MKALTEGRYRGRDGIWAVFDLGWNTELRVGVLEQDIGRVVMKRNGQRWLNHGAMQFGTRMSSAAGHTHVAGNSGALVGAVYDEIMSLRLAQNGIIDGL